MKGVPTLLITLILKIGRMWVSEFRRICGLRMIKQRNYLTASAESSSLPVTLRFASQICILFLSQFVCLYNYNVFHSKRVKLDSFPLYSFTPCLTNLTI